MHKLDSIINDIEPRIVSICNYYSSLEESSLQQAFASYGWILLDSWIAWRSLRFLLKELIIEDEIGSKWIQTPSSYRPNQIRPIWKFDDNTFQFIQNKCGESFNNIVNNISDKRNSCAHFSKPNNVDGVDCNKIKIYYEILSIVFRFYEYNSFLQSMEQKLNKKNYYGYKIIYDNGYECNISDFIKTIEVYEMSNYYYFYCLNRDHDERKIEFSKNGCRAIVDDKQKESIKDVINYEQRVYNFFNSKGYYRNVDLFINTVEQCWLEIKEH